MTQFVVFVALGAASALLQAQSYPVKPVRYLIPYAPGGGTDIVARTMSAKLT